MSREWALNVRPPEESPSLALDLAGIASGGLREKAPLSHQMATLTAKALFSPSILTR